jgi:Na+-transporting methylmalonyl-CoA/oxaloacetate decarboxylase gamma subunit
MGGMTIIFAVVLFILAGFFYVIGPVPTSEFGFEVSITNSPVIKQIQHIVRAEPPPNKILTVITFVSIVLHHLPAL